MLGEASESKPVEEGRMPDRGSYMHGLLTATFIAAGGSGLHWLMLDPDGPASGTLRFTISAMLAIGYFCLAAYVHVRESRRWRRAVPSR